MRMKSVHLGRKLSANAHLPKRSTIVESPTGRSVAPTDVLPSQRSQEGLQQQHKTPPQPQQQPSYGQLNKPHLGQLPPIEAPQVLRPAYARGNTEVMIVDDTAPNSPAIGDDPGPPSADTSITLADIPQLLETAQLREQHRSLPRQNSIPYIAELSALELAIVKHSAVLVLSRSPLKDQFDLDELLELVEAKKSGFWNKLFKGDKKNIKKKGVSSSTFVIFA